MIFWIMLILFVLSVALYILLDIVFDVLWDSELIGVISTSVSLISGFIVAIMIIAICVNNIFENSAIEENKQIYNSLVYQAENSLYENDNDLGKKELADQVKNWDEWLARGKALQNDF